MKVAIVHDSYLHVGGAEKVLLELLSIFSGADLYCPIINPKLKVKPKTKGTINTTILSNLPNFDGWVSIFKPLVIFYWESLDLSKYDLVISSSHSFNAKLIKVPAHIPHLSYIYTPPRYLANNFNEIKSIKWPLLKIASKPMIDWLKKKDQASGQRPTVMIAISQTIQKRIKQRYGRKSLVIYPPANTKVIYKTGQKNTYLCFSRLVKQKGIDLAIKSCNQLKKPLIVVGTGPQKAYLKSIAGPTIEFLDFVDDVHMARIFSRSKALINCAIEEDFGLVNVEALAYGVPIIAHRSGGQKETVIENKTGVFFNQHTVESVCAAIEKFEKMDFSPTKLHQAAQKFSTEIFRKKMMVVVNYLETKYA